MARPKFREETPKGRAAQRYGIPPQCRTAQYGATPTVFKPAAALFSSLAAAPRGIAADRAAEPLRRPPRHAAMQKPHCGDAPCAIRHDGMPLAAVSAEG